MATTSTSPRGAFPLAPTDQRQDRHHPQAALTERPTEHRPVLRPRSRASRSNTPAERQSPPPPTSTDTQDAESSPVPSAASMDTAPPKSPIVSLAHRGTDTTTWTLGRAGLLLVADTGAVVGARRRTPSEPEQDSGTGNAN